MVRVFGNREVDLAVPLRDKIEGLSSSQSASKMAPYLKVFWGHR